MDFLENFFDKNKEIIFTVSRNLFILTLILFLLGLSKVLEISKYFNEFLMQIIFAVSIILMIIIKQETLTKKNRSLLKKVVKILFIIFLLLIIISTLKYEWIQFIEVFLFSIQRTLILTIISIGILLFQQNKSPINNIGYEKEKEEQVEKKRHNEFSKKFPKLHSIPILGKIIRWMYKVGWVYSIALLLIITAGFVLRIWNMGQLSPAGDEFRHLIAAKRYIIEGFFQYDSGHITTWIIIFMKKLFNTNSLFVLRLPFVFLSIISTIFIYKIGRLINKKTAITATYLFAFCPLAIGLAGYIRGYEFSMFILIVSCFFILRNKKISVKSILTTALLLLVVYLISTFDKFTGLKGSFLLILSMAIFYFFSKFLNKFIRNKVLNVIIRWLFIILIIYIYRAAINTILHYGKHEYATWDYLYFFNYTHTGVLWYSSFIPFILILAIAIIPFLIRYKNSKVFALSLSTFLMFYFFIFYYSAPRTFQVRYPYFILPIIIILIATGAMYLYSCLDQKFRSKRYVLVLFVIMFLLIFSPFNAVHNTLNVADGESNKNTNLAHFDSEKLVTFLIENNISDKRILTSQPWIFDYYFNRDFLKESEKGDYVFFPESQWYEQLDRTKIWSINGLESEVNIKKGNQIIYDNKIEYLVLGALPNREYLEYKSVFILDNIQNAELIKIIDEGKTFGYYIFKINRFN